jgi:leucyl-tRNA synthetase
MQRYNPKEIEPKWQKIWDDQQIYKADMNSSKPKYMAMSMFNYPSGAGIHIGHAMNYTISDVKARFKRQLGHESYHPVGWDAFGLPAENYAIKAGVSPQESMAKIIPSYHKQYKAMGWSNDWSKEIATHEPDYYKWTQWIFLKMYENGLAYQDSRMQWWCTKCQTVLANEQIIDGKCWRHDGPDDPIVEQKEVKQWFFKITDYADELLDAIDDLDWTESVKLAQKNWIGRSIGAEVNFAIEGSDEQVTVFTTRVDTLYGATFLVLAPEHDLVKTLTTDSQEAEVEAYAKATQKKTEVERQANKEKTGVFTGTYAINPATKERIPVWIADYVLTGYGTGAIMAVPAHDERDNEFAKKFELPILEVVEPVTGIPRPDPEFRRSIVAILRNPKGNTFLSINWGKELGGNLFVGGGRDENEDIETCAKREILEETGYKNVQLVAQTGRIHHNYFAHSKNKNRRIEAYGLLFDLVDDAQEEQVLEADEQGKFTTEWLSQADAEAKIVDELHSLVYEQLVKGEIFHDEGILTNSGEFSGQYSSDARENIVKSLSEQSIAIEKVNYKMRDWSVSRQRYWGAPIPIIYCAECGTVPIPEDQLPVVLPELTDFAPSGDGRSALGRATEWLKVDCPKCGGPGERETDTLDTYICSSWYMLRYMDPHNTEKIFDSAVVNKWAPVDFYNGADHATAHMLYARFVTRFFTKIGLMNEPEPFKQFLFNGKVTAQDGTMFSKSKGNGVDPLEIIDSGYGADALRTYLMFAAPLELWVKWDPQGVPGTYRFLNRVWTLVQEYLAADPGEVSADVQKKLRHTTHSMIKKMTEDINANRYNTAIAAAMANVNELYKLKVDNLAQNDSWKESLEALVSCIAPFAPHIADELWGQLGNESSIQIDSWPTYNPDYLQTDEVTIVVQVNGKVRAELSVAADADEETIVTAAKDSDKVKAHIDGKEIRKVIYVPGKLVNIVV